MATSKPQPPSALSEPSSERLDSWKEIAAYLKRDKRTVRRWEKEGLPVHRKVHKSQASVFAYRAEIDAWWNEGRQRLELSEQAGPHGPRLLWMLASLVAFGVIALTALNFNVAGIRSRIFALEKRQIHSIAVLPLDNLSGDPSQDYFADGMTDELITDLAKIGSLKVISRTSVMQYKGTRKPLRQIASELNADAIVEGSVARSGNQIRVTAQLVQAPADRHLWAESYTRDLDNVLTLQNEVARSIAQEVHATLTPQESAKLTTKRLVNPEAYQDYLLGRFYWNKWTEADVRKSIQYYESALKISPDNAPVYAALADSYNSLGALGVGSLPSSEVSPKAKQAALRALELDETLAEAHTALGTTLLFYDWDWKGAEKELKRAIALNPSYSAAHHWYSHYLLAMKRYDESLAESKLAFELNPLDVLMTVHMSWHYFYAHDFKLAEEEGRKAVQMDPHFNEGYLMVGLALDQQGKHQEAIDELKKAVALSGRRPIVLSALGHAYATAGRRREAAQVLAELQSKKPDPNYEIAAVYSGLAETERAFQYLNAAVASHSGAMEFLPNDPCMESLHRDPRFAGILQRLGLI